MSDVARALVERVLSAVDDVRSDAPSPEDRRDSDAVASVAVGLVADAVDVDEEGTDCLLAIAEAYAHLCEALS